MKGRLPESRRVEIGLEAVELTAVAVAPHREVEHAEVGILVVVQAIGKQDHAGARAEQRRPGPRQRGDRLAQAVARR